MNIHREVAYRLDPALWVREVLGISPRTWQEQFLRVPRGKDVLVLTARQVGKTTIAVCAMAHTAIFKPGSLSVVACPAQRQSAEPIRKVKEMVVKAGATLITDNKYGIELANGSRVLALPSSDESIRGLTVDGWIVADEAAFLTDEVVAALRPMRAQRPEARYVMLSTANTRTDPFWSAWETGDQSWMRIAPGI
jgi:phage terminase large subunit-like protein